jgi:hypothetical protein
MRTMRVTEAHDYDLTGELIDAPRKTSNERLLQIAGSPPSRDGVTTPGVSLGIPVLTK